MKNLIIITLLINGLNIYGQPLPSDEQLAKSINEYFKSINQETSYKVVFKKYLNLEDKELLLIITETPTITLHGHQIGFRNLLFFNKNDHNNLITSISSEDEIPIGDTHEFKIVDIGINKKALLSTFQSTGNNHFEKNINFFHLTTEKLTFLVSVNSEYDNSAWIETGSKEQECNAIRYTEEYKILSSNKEWFDISIDRIDYKFLKGCQEVQESSKFNKILKYRNNKYVTE